MAVDECANLWPACPDIRRGMSPPQGRYGRCYELSPWGPTVQWNHLHRENTFPKGVVVTMAIREILLLGNPKLYEVCEPIRREDLHALIPAVQDLHDTLMRFREQCGVGRAIAAPQIGIMKRLIYMHLHRPVIFINPILDSKSSETMALWDDCMCFPDLLVKVERYQRCRIAYKDMEWKEQTMVLADDLSELLQHECDHLDGILAVSRAIDGRSFALRSQKKFYDRKLP
jgi:peptide deformylase